MLSLCNRKRSTYGHHRSTVANLSSGTRPRSAWFAILYVLRDPACHAVCAGAARARESCSGSAASSRRMAISECGAGSVDAATGLATGACNINPTARRTTMAVGADSGGPAASSGRNSRSLFRRQSANSMQSLRKHRRRAGRRRVGLPGMWMASSAASRLQARSLGFLVGAGRPGDDQIAEHLIASCSGEGGL